MSEVTQSLVFLSLSIWAQTKTGIKTERRLNRAPDDSYALTPHTGREKREGVRERERAHDLCNPKADISSLIRLRNDCNEGEWVRETEKWKRKQGRVIREGERGGGGGGGKERSERELIKMSAEVWRENGKRDEGRGTRKGQMMPQSHCYMYTSHGNHIQPERRRCLGCGNEYSTSPEIRFHTNWHAAPPGSNGMAN